MQIHNAYSYGGEDEGVMGGLVVGGRVEKNEA
jgi:hypothetical protein